MDAAESTAWPFVIVQARLLLAPDFLTAAAAHGRLLDAANPGHLSSADVLVEVLEVPEQGPVTLAFRKVRIKGEYVGRKTEWVRDEGTRPMLMIEGVALRGRHKEVAADLLAEGREQVLPAVRAYVDKQVSDPPIRTAKPIGRPAVHPPVEIKEPSPVPWRLPAALFAAGVTVGGGLCEILHAIFGWAP